MSRTASHGNHDGDTGINYFTYGDSTNPQWISHDNPDSIVEKVKFVYMPLWLPRWIRLYCCKSHADGHRRVRMAEQVCVYRH